MSIKVVDVPPRSLAARMGIRAGDVLRSINGEDISDIVDYYDADAQRPMRVELERGSNVLRARAVNKHRKRLGLVPEQDAAPRECENACVFCFVDQLPPDARPSLLIKDDDWRASLTAGNFVTLTNVDDAEFERILRRRVSPLFISVHVTDGDLRARMMRNERAAHIMDRLRALRDAGLRFHAQIVLCPGYNDGAALDRTIRDLAALHPATQSVAIVPVGLTKHREGQCAVKPVTTAFSRALIPYIALYQGLFKRKLGTRLVYLADEFYLRADRVPPPYKSYEGFPQLSNGVGLLRLFERQYIRARNRPHTPRQKDIAPLASPITDAAHPGTAMGDVVILTGVSAAPWMRGLLEAYPIEGVTERVSVVPVVNRFLGDSVTVAGLVAGGDIIAQVKPGSAARTYIPRSMLRAGGDVFLDDTTLRQVSDALGMPVIPVEVNGRALIEALTNKLEGAIYV